MVLPRADLVSCTLPSTPIFLLLPSDYAPPSTFPGSYRRSPRPQLARLSPRSWPLGRRFRGQIYLAHIGLPCITRLICTNDNQSIRWGILRFLYGISCAQAPLFTLYYFCNLCHYDYRPTPFSLELCPLCIYISSSILKQHRIRNKSSLDSIY